MVTKDNFIELYGEDAYEKILVRGHERYKVHKEEIKARVKKWKEEHPEKVEASAQERRRGGRHYDKTLIYSQTGLRHERNLIRKKHEYKWRRFKRLIAPGSHIHHEWIPGTAKYRGIGLVEKDQHMHGFVDVIKILDGKITLLTEEEVKRKGA